MNQVENRLISVEASIDTLEASVSSIELSLDCKLDSIESSIYTLESSINAIESIIEDKVSEHLKELKVLLMEQTLINNGWKQLVYEKWFPAHENQYSHMGEDLESAYYSLKLGCQFTEDNPALQKIKKQKQND